MHHRKRKHEAPRERLKEDRKKKKKREKETGVCDYRMK